MPTNYTAYSHSYIRAVNGVITHINFIPYPPEEEFENDEVVKEWGSYVKLIDLLDQMHNKRVVIKWETFLSGVDTIDIMYIRYIHPKWKRMLT